MKREREETTGCDSTSGEQEERTEKKSDRVAQKASSTHLLLAELDTVVLSVPLTERGGINLYDAALHQGVGAHQLVVGRVVHHTQDTALASDGYATQKEEEERKVRTLHTDDRTDTLRTQRTHAPQRITESASGRACISSLHVPPHKRAEERAREKSPPKHIHSVPQL
jgi:hypothetical protein